MSNTRLVRRCWSVIYTHVRRFPDLCSTISTLQTLFDHLYRRCHLAPSQTFVYHVARVLSILSTKNVRAARGTCFLRCNVSRVCLPFLSHLLLFEKATAWHCSLMVARILIIYMEFSWSLCNICVWKWNWIQGDDGPKTQWWWSLVEEGIALFEKHNSSIRLV